MSADRLPIYEIEPALLRAWRERAQRRRFVVEAPTGSGKSTQLPQILDAHGLTGGGKIEIRKTMEALSRERWAKNFDILPLPMVN